MRTPQPSTKALAPSSGDHWRIKEDAGPGRRARPGMELRAGRLVLHVVQLPRSCCHQARLKVTPPREQIVLLLLHFGLDQLTMSLVIGLCLPYL